MIENETWVVIEKFLGACTYTVHKDSLASAKHYVYDEQIARHECFYQALTKRSSFKFQVVERSTFSGGYVVQVFAPTYGTFSTKPNMMVMYRIEKAIAPKLSEQEFKFEMELKAPEAKVETKLWWDSGEVEQLV